MELPPFLMPKLRLIAAFAASLALLLGQHCSSPDSADKHSTERFRFIFCNDLHIGEGGRVADSVAMAHVIGEWRTKVPSWDFVVLAGDLTENGDLAHMQWLKTALDSLHKPYYTVIGNHDITNDTDENGKKNYLSVFGDNRLNYLIMHKNVGLVFLDLSNGAKTTVTVKVSTKLWLKKILANFPSKMPIIVFSHFPLNPETPRFSVMNSEELFRYLDKRNVIAYLSGHYHGVWFGFRNKIPFYTNVRLLPFADTSHVYSESGYYLVDVFGSSVGVTPKRTR